MMLRHRGHSARLFAALLALTLLAAACGGSDPDTSAAETSAAASDTTEAPAATAEPAPEPTEPPAPTDEPAAAEPDPTAEPAAAVETVAIDVASLPAVDNPELVAAGMAVFESNCAGCHGSAGEGTQRGRPLLGIADQQPDRLVHAASVVNGKGNMPAFGDRLTAADVDAVVAYSRLTFLAAVAEEAAATDPAVLAMGAELFTQACARCHGAAGEGTQRGRPLIGIAGEQPDASVHIASVTDGKGNMPAFAESLTAEQIAAVVAYTRETF